jgi:hypothetical protein
MASVTGQSVTNATTRPPWGDRAWALLFLAYYTAGGGVTGGGVKGGGVNGGGVTGGGFNIVSSFPCVERGVDADGPKRANVPPAPTACGTGQETVMFFFSLASDSMVVTTQTRSSRSVGGGVVLSFRMVMSSRHRLTGVDYDRSGCHGSVAGAGGRTRVSRCRYGFTTGRPSVGLILPASIRATSFLVGPIWRNSP